MTHAQSQMSPLGPRIAALREGYGLDLEAVSRLSGLPASQLAAIEAAEAPMSTYQLSKIAGALAINPAELLAPTPAKPAPRSAAKFRMATPQEGLSANDQRLLAKANEVGLIGESLRALLGREAPQVRALRKIERRNPQNPWAEGYRLGRAARQALAPDAGPIRSMQRLLEEGGVHVAYVELESRGVEAVSLLKPDALPLILLNRRHRRVQAKLSRRALLAHELCHLLVDGGRRDLHATVTRDASHDPMEQRANSFAPSFIAPPEGLEGVSGLDRDAVRGLARAWGLSYDGVVYHLQNLHLISNSATNALLAQRASVPARRFEPTIQRRRAEPLDEGVAELQVEPLVEGLVSDWAIEAYDRELISRGRLRELLRLR